MISIQLNEVFQNSVTFAKEHKHEYLTIEHIFLSILNSQEGQDIFEALEVDRDILREEIAEHIIDNIPSLNEEIDPFETMALNSAISAMMSQIRSSGSKEATVGDMLVSIFAQKESYALQLMKREGIERLDILQLISHTDDGEYSENSSKKDDDTALSK